MEQGDCSNCQQQLLAEGNAEQANILSSLGDAKNTDWCNLCRQWLVSQEPLEEAPYIVVMEGCL